MPVSLDMLDRFYLVEAKLSFLLSAVNQSNYLELSGDPLAGYCYFMRETIVEVSAIHDALDDRPKHGRRRRGV